MKTACLCLFLQWIAVAALGQDYSGFQSGINEFIQDGLRDSSQRTKKLNDHWTALQTAHRIPLIVEDSVAFLYRGFAKTVEWTGDFNAWGYLREVDNKGKRIPGTDVWMLKASFPKNTRLDYKIVLNGQTQILDPENQHQQWSGVGGGSPNSELRMPEWKEDAVLQARPDIPKGTVKEEILYNSKTLGYQLSYSVYLPSHYDGREKLPSLYVTDGYEYMHPKLGNMVTILDNLLADKKIKRLVVIFVDHREPINRSNNKRMEELAMNPKYLAFFEEEFIPLIESHYSVDTAFATRGILGSSMGGLTAAYFAFGKPGLFGMAGIQSPAFWVRPQIYTLCNTPDNPIKVSMTSGLISDASEGSRKMKDILQTNACQYHYKEVNDGHSWGNWRNLIDDVLIDLFGN
jgi:enterochelin esterase-like enzyme